VQLLREIEHPSTIDETEEKGDRKKTYGLVCY